MDHNSVEEFKNKEEGEILWYQRVLRSSLPFCFIFSQGDTPKHRAEKANDPDLAAYLENRQHYQMIQREDQETAV